MRCKEKLLVAAMFLVLRGAPVYAVDLSLNVQQMSHLGQQTIGGLTDVWGWYDSQNTKYYALACNAGDLSQPRGVRIVDATDPTQPIIVGTLAPELEPAAVDVMVAGDYAYVTSQQFNPSQIWIYYLPTAIVNPTNPPARVITLMDNIFDPVNYIYPLNNAHNVFVEGNLLFLPEMYTFSPDPAEVAVIDVTNPAAPILLNVWDYSHFDADFVSTHDVYVKQDTAYIFCYGPSSVNAGVFQALFNRTNGQVISWKKIRYDPIKGDVQNISPEGFYYCLDNEGLQQEYPKRPFAHSGWLTSDGRYLLVADETPGGYLDCMSKIAPCLRIFDIANFRLPGDPTPVPLKNAFDVIWSGSADQYIAGAPAIDQATEPDDETPCPLGNCDNVTGPSYIDLGIHNPHVKGKLAFMSWYSRGLQVLDLTDISNIKHAGFFDHGVGNNWGAGDWHQEAYGVYPFSPDGYVYVSGDQGLYIYRYGYTGTLDTNATWQGDVYIYDTLTVASGRTLNIKPGTTVYMFKNSAINVNGNLTANGWSTDSIRFFALGPIPQPGDWQGIHFLPNSSGTLRYCSIRHAVIGIEMEDNSNIQLAHCLVKSNSSTGVDNYKGALRADSSRFEGNVNYGVYSYKAESKIDSCTFRTNWKYAINCWLAPLPPLDSSIVSRCSIDLAGVPLCTVQRLLGHAQIDTTMIYAHLAEEHSAEMMAKLPY